MKLQFCKNRNRPLLGIKKFKEINPHHHSSSQSGFVLVCLLILLGLLFSLAALALDSGNLYLHRLRLERSARAAVLAGLGYRSLVGWQAICGVPNYTLQAPSKPSDPNHPYSKLLNLVQSTLAENIDRTLAPANLQYSEDRINFSNEIPGTAYDPIFDTIVVTVSLSVPSILAGRLRNMGVPIGCSSDANDPSACRVVTTQGASLKPATIGMVLDTSGSMACLDGEPNCACRTTGTCNAPANRNNQLIKKLKDAALEFHKFFNPFRDRIAVVPFNIGATLARPIMGPAANGVPSTPQPFGANQTAYNAFLAAINGLQPLSNTNHCDGLATAARELQLVRNSDRSDPNALTDSPLFYVFFTDGAPNAMRGRFSNPATALAGEPGAGQSRLSQAATGQATNDWYQYTLEWTDNTRLPPLSPTYRGPGPLVHGSARLFNFQIGTKPDGVTPNVYPSIIPGSTNPWENFDATPCGDVFSTRAEFDHALNGCVRTNAGPGIPCNPVPNNKRPGCLNGVDFSVDILGSSTGTVAGVPLSPIPINGIPASTPTSIIDQIHYYCAVEVSDWIRQAQNAPIYTVGLGEEADPACTDPLQDSDNHFRRKDNYLRRVAFTRDTRQEDPTINPTQDFSPAWNDFANYSLRPAPIPITSCPATHRLRALNATAMPFGYNRIVTANGVQQTPPLPVGTVDNLTPNDFGATEQARDQLTGLYYGTNQAADLSTFFTRIAKQILLRLGT